ncbi:hypothetical protein [Novipirellula artificiosorum]|uniref:Secreted protein n=1 Tax=Novipirellula artificiosorum TaxID=2528016 RepID=A0A5C6DBZ7_9BACT|nr:hypothetical protein [Novipirellula artificiosorum]TWU34228.1 hypothetical protein Poly41_43740 [Novipirellula artificiosorum]
MSALTALLVFLASAIVPSGSAREPETTQQQVDLIELNHFVDSDGREVFQQVIFYDWSKASRRFHVRAWRLIKAPDQLPIRQFSPPMYHCSWYEDRVKRKVNAPTMRETWSQQDPERVNRKFLPEDQRVPLWPPAVAAKNDGPGHEESASRTQ